MLNTTLCYLKKDGCYLMLYRNKKENDPCEGKWVGIGGKFEPGETKEDCLLREVREETGLILTDYQYHGVVHFVSDCLEDEEMCLFSATGWEGEIEACNEGTLKWIPEDEVLSLNLWEGDPYFLKPLLSQVGKRVVGITVRMILLGQLAVGLFDLFLGGVSGNTQYVIGIFIHDVPPLQCLWYGRLSADRLSVSSLPPPASVC